MQNQDLTAKIHTLDVCFISASDTDLFLMSCFQPNQAMSRTTTSWLCLFLFRTSRRQADDARRIRGLHRRLETRERLFAEQATVSAGHLQQQLRIPEWFRGEQDEAERQVGDLERELQGLEIR